MSNHSEQKKSFFQSKLFHHIVKFLLFLIVLNAIFLTGYYLWLSPTFNLKFLDLKNFYNWFWLEGCLIALIIAFKLRKFIYLAIFLALIAIAIIVVLTIFNL